MVTYSKNREVWIQQLEQDEELYEKFKKELRRLYEDPNIKSDDYETIGRILTSMNPLGISPKSK